MKGRRFFTIAFGFMAVGVGGAGISYLALQQIPAFYQAAMQDTMPPVQRREAAERFVERTMQLVEEIRHAETWEQEFSEQQINSWLAEELHQKHQSWVPRGVRDPRVKLTEDAIQIGFHLKQKRWSGIVSLKVTPWMEGPNRLAVGIESAQAGVVPIPLDEVLRHVAKNLARDGWQIEWSDRDGLKVAVVDLGAGRERQPVLQTVDVLEGLFRVSGKQPDSGSGEIRFEAPRVATRGASPGA